ncbi:O-antigen translocase [Vibrio vulnificus]|nr:O-antigen translocase [Vibrio vulnificus]
MNLIKTSILSFIATAVRLISGLIINKAIALYIGPSGLATIGQFQNFLQLTMVASQGAINAGVTKYTAEYGKESDELPVLFSTAFKISVSCSLSVCIVMFLFSNYLAQLVFKDLQYSYIFVILGFTIIFYTLNALMLSILNGLKEISLFIRINISQSVFGLIFTTLLIFFIGLDGALIALATNQSIIFLLLSWKIRKHAIIKLHNFRLNFNREVAIKLSKYAAMAITSAISIPLSHIYIRNYIGESIGWVAAGYWQAVWYISSMYLMVVTTALTTYYLPRLSEIKDKIELRSELFNGYKVILPIVSALALCIFLLKDIIITLLFSNDFSPMRELFIWQVIGDVVKLASWLLGYILIAKAMYKIVIITELFFSVSFCAFTVFFVQVHGLEGVSMAYLANYILHLFVMLIIILKNRLI